MDIQSAIPITGVMTRTLVCIDNYRDSILEGTVRSTVFENPIEFKGFVKLFKILDDMLDMLAFPQKSLDYRLFSRYREDDLPAIRRPEVFTDETAFTAEHGKKASFIIQIQFRQNATWQGSIRWIEEKKSQNFRSSLELIKLMDDALLLSDSIKDLASDNWESED